MKKAVAIICTCGHPKKAHESVLAPIWEGWCNGGKEKGKFAVRMKDKKGKITLTCFCCEYTPDNLLYIELLAKKRKLI